MMYSNKFEDLLAGFEGLRLQAYRDQKGIPTIGIGTIEYEDGRAVKMGDTITKERAYQLMRGDLAQRCIKVSSLLSGVDVKPHQFDALLSFAYNVGTAGLAQSTLPEAGESRP
jgi:lysozyme